MELKDEYENFYKYHFGDIELSAYVFYKFPIGIRFKIGEGDYKSSNYVEAAVRRAMAIFSELFNQDDIVFIVINSFEDNPNDLAINDISAAQPLINLVLDKYSYDFRSAQDDFSCKRYVMKSSVRSIQILKLIEEIVRSDIYGVNSLNSGVYLFNERNGILYHLYDDRGLDVIADDKGKLIGLYSKFNDWILDYDRGKIDRVFLS